MLQTQTTQGRVLHKNVVDEGRLTRLESNGYKSKDNSNNRPYTLWVLTKHFS